MHRVSGQLLLSFSFVLAMSLGVAAPAGAAMLKFDAVSLGGSGWRYDYVVETAPVDAPLREFALFFAPALYANLRDWQAPTGWDAVLAQPSGGPDLFDDGFVDYCAQGPLLACDGAGLAPGGSLGGFSVAFDWLGVGTPGSQPFELRDPESFDVLGTGRTVASVVVPEPGSAALWFAVLPAAFAFSRRHRRRMVRVAH